MIVDQQDMLVGFAQLLDTAGVAKYRGDGSEYAEGETAIVFGEMTPAGPCVALTLYDQQDLDWSTARYWIQARIRTSSDPLDLELVDGVHTALAWRRHPPMPDGVDVVQIVPQSFARLGRVAGEHVYTRNFSALT